MTHLEMSNVHLSPIRPCPDAAVEALGDELMIVVPGREAVISLNPTAALVWTLCDGARDEAAIVAALRDAYPDAPDALGEEVHAVIQNLLDAGALFR